MWLVGLSLLAGMLTVLAPCVLPLLPVIIGTSLDSSGKRNNRKPLVIVWSFSISVLLFTLGLRQAVLSLWLHPDAIVRVAAVVIIVFGIFLLFPNLRKKIAEKTWLESKTWWMIAKTKWWPRSNILLGVVLWPVLNSCSPTYGFLIGTVLPGSFYYGLVNIIAYVVGLAIVLLAIAYGGRRVIKNLRRASNPTGLFKKIIALLLILVWTAVYTGVDKDIEARLYEKWLVIDTTQFEIDAVEEFDKE